MWRVAAIVVLASSAPTCLSAQSSETQGCAATQKFAPVLVSNVGARVTFQCDRASPLDVIRATGRQSRRPIGVVLGTDPNRLSRPIHSYDLVDVSAETALRKAIEGTGYTLKRDGKVLVLTAGDLSPRQKDLLLHRYADFVPGKDQTMVELGSALTMWIRATVDRKVGFAWSILSSTNEERFTLEGRLPASTEEIANRIVCLGSKGMWIFRVDAAPPTSVADWADQVSVEPYQHYSNRPLTRHRSK